MHLIRQLSFPNHPNFAKQFIGAYCDGDESTTSASGWLALHSLEAV